MSTAERARLRPAPKRQLEKAVEADVIRTLKTLGFAVSKTSQPRASMLTLGLPDLYFSHPKWKLRGWCEVKAEGGKLSLWQRSWHAKERAAGGTVLVVWSVADLIRDLRALGAPLTP